MTDFVGECVDYVRKCSEFTGQHYPERAGTVLVINVPGWFKMIWNVVKPMVDEVTLKKIRILRGKQEIFNEVRICASLWCGGPVLDLLWAFL